MLKAETEDAVIIHRAGTQTRDLSLASISALTAELSPLPVKVINRRTKMLCM